MSDQQNVSSYIRSFNILFYALLAGQAMFTAIAFFLRYSGAFINSNENLEKIFIYIVPSLYAIAVAAGTSIFKKKLPVIKMNPVFVEKLSAYRAVYILRFALMEGACLFAIIVYLITGRQMFLLLAVLCILTFFVLKPSKSKLVNELELSSEEALMIVD